MTDGVIGVIGVGALAAAIVTGLCDGVEDPPRVLLSPRGAATSATLASRFPSVSVAADNQAVVGGADVVLVSVRPRHAEQVLRDLRFADQQVVISLVAGLGLDVLADWAAPATRFARAVPLPAVATREGVTPVFPPVPEAIAVFDLLGRSMAVDDLATYDALAASSATVAAHFDFLGAIAEWLVGEGLSEPDARGYVAATFAGAADALRDGAPDFDELKTEVSTPGGLNEQFALHLRQAGIHDAVHRGLAAVLARLRA